MQLHGHGKQSVTPSHNHVLRQVIGLLLLMGEHLRSRIEQEESEDAQHPFKALHHGHARKDKDAAQYQGPEDSPEEHLVLVFAFNAEEREQHQEHEEVIHR